LHGSQNVFPAAMAAATAAATMQKEEEEENEGGKQNEAEETWPRSRVALGCLCPYPVPVCRQRQGPTTRGTFRFSKPTTTTTNGWNRFAGGWSLALRDVEWQGRRKSLGLSAFSRGYSPGNRPTKSTAPKLTTVDNDRSRARSPKVAKRCLLVLVVRAVPRDCYRRIVFLSWSPASGPSGVVLPPATEQGNRRRRAV
jgi:hypothetical protein